MEEGEKNIITMFTVDGKFNYGNALLYLENITKYQKERIEALEEAMQFFSEWYNTTQRVNILVPEHLNNTGGIILPSNMTNGSKSIMD